MESTGSADFYMAGFQVATYGRFWVAAEGDTREEAMKNIGEVLHIIVDELVDEGKEVPADALIASTESPAVLVTV
jgi:hypothetical protein